MSVVYKTNVKEAISNKPNAATAFNLAAAATQADGVRNVLVAYADTEQLPYFVSDGAGLWEDGIGTVTGTTLVRSVINESSNSGSAVDFSVGSALTLIVALSAKTAQDVAASNLTTQVDTVTTANLTGVVGKIHLCTIAGLTANRDFVLPDVCAVGDRVGVYIVDGDPSFELILKASVGDDINSGVAGAEWSRLFIAGEIVIFRCVTANASWIVEHDGRIAVKAELEISTSPGGEITSAFTQPTQATTPGVWAISENVGDCLVATNDEFICRRNNSYFISAQCRPNLQLSANSIFSFGIFKDAVLFLFSDTTGLLPTTTGIRKAPLLTGNSLIFKYRSGDGGRGLKGAAQSIFSICEVF